MILKYITERPLKSFSQVLEEPETLSAHELVIVVQWWCRKCWALASKYELTAEKFQDFTEKLAEQVSSYFTTLLILI